MISAQPGVDELVVGVDDGVAAVAPDRGHLRRKLVGEEDVVVTQPGEVRARHRVDAGVQHGRYAAVRPAKEPDPVAVPFRDGDRGTVIGRAVVDDDDLDVRPGLRERAVDGLG